MKSKALTKIGIIFLLLLIYIQQMGAGLLVHNLVHDKKADQVPLEQKENGREINFACKCIDDFLMPFVAADPPPVLNKPDLVVATFDDYTEEIHYTPLIIASLRGPPALIG